MEFVIWRGGLSACFTGNYMLSHLVTFYYVCTSLLFVQYCSVIWDPHSSFLITQLANVEKFALRVCLKSWNFSYMYMELTYKAGIVPLRARRICAKL